MCGVECDDMYCIHCVIQECSVCVKCSECVGLACVNCECSQSDVTQREELLS